MISPQSPPESSKVSDQPQALETTRTILAQLLPDKQQDCAVRLWKGEVLPPAAGSTAGFTLVLNHPGALRRMSWPPGKLTLAEAYLRGDFDIEGEMVAAMQLAEKFVALTRSEWERLASLNFSLPNSDPDPVYLEGRQRT